MAAPAPAPARLMELLAINRTIAAASDYGALLRVVVERTATFLESDTAALLLADEHGQATIAASVGLDRFRARSFRAPLDEGIGAKLCHFIGCVPDRFLAAPVVESGAIRGVLAVYRDAGEFSDADAVMLSALADQAAIALVNVKQMQRLEDAVSALRDADRRKDEFLGMLSHELRNPLAPIRTAIFLLTRVDPQSDSAMRARQVIQRQTDHLTRLIDDLLDVTRIARGKITLRRESVNVTDVVRRAAEDHRSLLASRGLRFDLDIPPDPVWVEGDPTRLAQVVGNLLQNAAKFTADDGAVMLTLRTTGAAVEISVRDTGTGIEPEMLDRVFEPFVQCEQTLARTGGGLGLGLALVKGIVELHLGSVHALSAGLGHGTEFIVSLPRASSPSRDRARPARSADRVTSRRVLVIDDNRDAAESLAELVALFGHSVDVAYDGPTALQRLASNPPDIVLCDIGLPGMSGYELAKMIRERVRNGIRLIAVSGYAQPDDIKKAIDAGFDAHIAKPPDPAVIDRLLS